MRIPSSRLRARVVALALASVALVALGATPLRADTLLPFTALLNGGQEFPRVSSPSQGEAFLTFNATQALLCYSISFSPLSSNELAAHFHAPAPPGQNAPVRFDISPAPSPFGSPKTGCVGPLAKEDVKNLKRGLFYINVHSTMHPNGEIRGQVLRTPGTRYRAPAIAFSPSGAFLDPQPAAP